MKHLFEVGLGILAVAALHPEIDRLAILPAWFYVGLLIIGLAFLIVGAVLWIRHFIEEHRQEPRYSTEKLRKGDIPALRKFMVDRLGPDVLSVAETYKLYDRNPNMFFGIYEEKTPLFGFSNTRRLVGHFSLVPITEAARKLLKQNQLKGNQFTTEYITSMRKKPAGFYIGGIISGGTRARGQTMGALLGRIALEAKRKSPHFYTRPISPDGMRLTKKYGFEPVIQGLPDPMATVHYKHYTSGEEGE
ncbi:MAG: hypothetical protein QOK24_1569 [Verrucomicrobiota bacterium]|jgi:hypothetical protein